MSRLTFNSLAVTGSLQKQHILAFTKILERGIFLHGPENTQLAQLLSQTFNSPVTLVASGHDALLLSLQSLHLRSADEVIIPANAYPTAFAVALSRSTLVLADVDDNGQLSVDSVTRTITKKTKVIIMVHMYGATGDIDSIRRICKQKNIVFIEDCAQAFGTRYKHKLVGTFGTFGCFSFYPTKNIGAFGDGGAICSPNKSRISQIQKLSFYGEKIRYKSMFVTGHSNLPELQAVGIQIMLKTSQKNFLARKRVSTWYKKSLEHLTPLVKPLQSNALSSAVPHLFVVRVKYRNELIQFLAKQNIPTMVHYPTPVHLVRAFSYLGYAHKSFPVAESQAKEILSLPFSPSMTKSDIQSVANALTAFYTHSDATK